MTLPLRYLKTRWQAGDIPARGILRNVSQVATRIRGGSSLRDNLSIGPTQSKYESSADFIIIFFFTNKVPGMHEKQGQIHSEAFV